jgi:hypothetical protein
MTWPRFVGRNHIQGDYDDGPDGLRSAIAGDARRLEQDSRDHRYGHEIAKVAGVEPEVARRVLDAFFNDSGNPLRWPHDFRPRLPEGDE